MAKTALMSIKYYDKELKKIEKISKLINESNAIKAKINDLYIKTYIYIKKNINSEVIKHTLWQEKKNILCKSSQKINLIKLPLLCHKLISEYHDVCTIEKRVTILYNYGVSSIFDLEMTYYDIYYKIKNEWYNSNSVIYRNNYCVNKMKNKISKFRHNYSWFRPKNTTICIHCVMCNRLLHKYKNTDKEVLNFSDKDYYDYNRDSYCSKCYEDNILNTFSYHQNEAYILYKRKK
jgi:hypothetical protein